MFWNNKSINVLVNSSIVEYDIKSGNTSVMRQFQLTDENEISRIESLAKKDRVIAVGNMMKDKDFSKALESGFNTVVDEFLKKNNLDRDDDVLMIMRDAVFVIVKPIQYQDIGSCHFRPKGSYSGFLRCSPYEFLVASDHIDVKGMKDEDLDLHKNGVLQMIRDVYDACSEYHMDTIKISQYLKELLVAYKEKALPLDYYREFNSTGKFKLIYDSHDIMMDSITEEDLPELSIDYNYVKIILPLIRNLI